MKSKVLGLSTIAAVFLTLPLQAEDRKVVALVEGAVYTTSDSVQNPEVRLQSISGTGCNASITISGVSVSYYAPPLQQWGEWKKIETGFIGVHNFSVSVRPVGDCTLVGEVKYY